MNGRIVAGIVAGVLVFGAAALRADDDLALVKKAVAANTVAQAASDQAQASTPGKRPEWLKVRVVAKGEKKSKVTVNLPIAVVRAFGDDWPLDWGCRDPERERKRCKLKISDVLDTLQSGQSLVEVDDEGDLVRIWVE